MTDKNGKYLHANTWQDTAISISHAHAHNFFLTMTHVTRGLFTDNLTTLS